MACHILSVSHELDYAVSLQATGNSSKTANEMDSI